MRKPITHLASVSFTHPLTLTPSLMKLSRRCCLLLLTVALLPALSQAQYTDNYQTNTISAVTSNWAGNGTYVIGSNTFADALLIQNSGVLSNGSGYLGYEAGGSNNLVLVTGSGSVWSNSGALWLGNYGSGNSLVISNGGRVYNDGVISVLGSESSSSNNTVLVTGSGSVWSNSGALWVGNYGSGNSLVISSSGQVAEAGCYVGYNATANNNTVLVNGSRFWYDWFVSQTNLYVGNFLSVGYSGSGNSLVISNGHLVVENDCIVGYYANASNNTVLVNNSVWSNRDLYVGYIGSGNSMAISNGSLVFADNGIVGVTGNGNSVVVDHSDWTNRNFLYVGSVEHDYGGSGNSLVIQAQSRVWSDFGIVGNAYCEDECFADTSSNTVLVTSAGSWLSKYLWVGYGYANSNSLVITKDGEVRAGSLSISPSAGRAGGMGHDNVVRVESGWAAQYGFLGVDTYYGGDGVLTVGPGDAELIVNDGADVWAQALMVTNAFWYIVTRLTYNGGHLECGSADIANGAVLQFALGINSHPAIVDDTLTLGGTLNVTDGGGFTNTTYTLFTYGGPLVYNGLAIGTTPNPSFTYTISTNTPGQVNLVVAPPLTAFEQWQLLYFGSTNCARCGGTADYDGDGMSNTNEFLAGFNPTNPTNSAAYLHIISLTKAGNDMKVTYLGANGDSNASIESRTNVLEFTNGRANGSYSNNFVSAGVTNILSGGTGLGVVTNMVDVGGATNRPACYYRVHVLVP